MRDHLRLLGILNIVWSVIGLAIGLIVLLVFGGMAGFIATTGANSDDGRIVAAPLMAIVGVGIVLIICIVSLPALIAGIGLVKLKPWSRVLGIVISIFHLFSIPIGTALGVYGLWVLFQPEARQVLEGGSVLPVPPMAST